MIKIKSAKEVKLPLPYYERDLDKNLLKNSTMKEAQLDQYLLKVFSRMEKSEVLSANNFLFTMKEIFMEGVKSVVEK